jgi:hypothetical protein
MVAEWGNGMGGGSEAVGMVKEWGSEMVGEWDDGDG